MLVQLYIEQLDLQLQQGRNKKIKMSKIGAHVSGHPRLNIEQFCRAKPAAILGLDDSGVLLEAKEWSNGHVWTLYRTTEVYGERPSDLHNPPGTYAQMANYWYHEASPSLKKKYDQNPADIYIPDNEPTGGESDDPNEIIQNCRNLVAYERELMKLMNADGKKMGVLALAGGSPGHFAIWVEECVPFIKEAFDTGNWYARHAYEGNWDRVRQEAQYLLDHGLGYGPMVITEWGFNGGYGKNHDINKIKAENDTLMAYPNVVSFCLWEFGKTTFDANIDSIVPQLASYMEANPTPKWEWQQDEEPPPDEEPPTEPWQTTVWNDSIKEQEQHGITFRRTHGLHSLIVSKSGYAPVTNEISIETADGIYGYQSAEHLTDINAPRITLAYKKPWSGTSGVIELTSGDAPENMLNVDIIDVSRHQNKKDSNQKPIEPVNFEKMRIRGISGTYIRSSLGGFGLDDAFEMNWKAAISTGIKHGMYHLINTFYSARQNLDNLIKVVRQYGHGDFRIAFDVEPLKDSAGNYILINGNKVRELIDLFKQAFGYEPLIYTAKWVMKYVYGDTSWASNSLLWVADYWNSPPLPGQYPRLPGEGSRDLLLMHQWTSSYHDGREWGVASVGLDFNIAYALNELLVSNVTIPQDPPPPPPSDDSDLVNVGIFMRADPSAFRVVRHPDGRQEDIQDMDLGNNVWVRRKNDLGEWWKFDKSMAWLIHDTSPDVAHSGSESDISRVYTLYKNMLSGAPKNPVLMKVGQLWIEDGTHFVQFRAKNGCSHLSTNSGIAQNQCEFVKYAKNHTFNAYGQNLTIDEVIWLKTGEEIQIYGKHAGKVIGWIGWQFPGVGKSEITELYWDRPKMTTEPNRFCSF